MSSNASGDHQRGQKLYQKGDYKAALEALTKALIQQDVDTIGVLDNRAATHCKLEQYGEALRDARKMIRQDNQDERGYLRCAKVILLQGKPDKALEVYAYGLKTLASEHPKRNILEKMHKKLQQHILLRKKDPFTLLPFEMALMVLQHFSFKQMVAIMRVSKGWHQLLSSIPHLWQSMDLTGARGTVPFTAVQSYIRKSKGLLTHAIIKNLPAPQVPRSLEFLSRCPHIESLELWVTQGHKEFLEVFKRCKKVKNLFFSADMPIPIDYVGRLFIEFRKLERITVQDCAIATRALRPLETWPRHLPNLKSIALRVSNIAGELYGIPLCIPLLISNIQPHPYENLEELRLDWDPPKYYALYFPEDFTGDIGYRGPGDDQEEKAPPSLRHLDLRGVMPSFSIFSVLPKSLESMRFSGGSSSRTALALDHDDISLPSLHTLIFNDTAWMNKRILEIFLFNLQPPIRKLYLNQCFNLDLDEFLEIYGESHRRNPELAKLEELGFSQCRNADDSWSRALRDMFRQLKVLDLSFTNITGCTIREFADTRRDPSDPRAKLDRLIVRGCERVSSDAVLYGQAMGLEIVT